MKVNLWSYDKVGRGDGLEDQDVTDFPLEVQLSDIKKCLEMPEIASVTAIVISGEQDAKTLASALIQRFGSSYVVHCGYDDEANGPWTVDIERAA